MVQQQLIHEHYDEEDEEDEEEESDGKVCGCVTWRGLYEDQVSKHAGTQASKQERESESQVAALLHILKRYIK